MVFTAVQKSSCSTCVKDCPAPAAFSAVRNLRGAAMSLANVATWTEGEGALISMPLNPLSCQILIYDSFVFRSHAIRIRKEARSGPIALGINSGQVSYHRLSEAGLSDAGQELSVALDPPSASDSTRVDLS